MSLCSKANSQLQSQNVCFRSSASFCASASHVRFGSNRYQRRLSAPPEGEKFGHGNEPQKKLKMGFEGRPRVAGVVRHRKQNRWGLHPPDPSRGKEAKTQGVRSVRATRQPLLLWRLTARSGPRTVAWRTHGPSNQDPPRRTRRLQSPAIQAEPSGGRVAAVIRACLFENDKFLECRTVRGRRAE